MSSLISKLYVVSSLCFAIIAFSVRSQLAGSLQMLLLVIQSAFRPSKSNKHHVLFDRMFSTFLCCLRFFPAQVSSFIGHKFLSLSEAKRAPGHFPPISLQNFLGSFFSFSVPVFVGLQRFNANFDNLK